MTEHLNNCYLNPEFSHIYVEESIQNDQRTIKIISRFPHAVIIPIKNYKDIFNRTRQSAKLQIQSRQLILAKKEGTLIFPGAKVCQSFDHEYFYYTSNILNCIYNCEYCYLKGMYPSSHLVCFVNLSNTFKELELLLSKHPVYLCISYDTDLAALEPIFGFLREWIAFAKTHPDLTLEVRTKSANLSLMQTLPPLENVIYAWTLSPNTIITSYEHNTPSLSLRLAALTTAIKAGHPVRLCFDPMLYFDGWKSAYSQLVTQTFAAIKATCSDVPVPIKDVEIGVFRISKQYLKLMRHRFCESPVVMYPYETEELCATYPKELTKALLTHMKQALLPYLHEEQIYLS